VQENLIKMAQELSKAELQVIQSLETHRKSSTIRHETARLLSK